MKDLLNAINAAAQYLEWIDKNGDYTSIVADIADKKLTAEEAADLLLDILENHKRDLLSCHMDSKGRNLLIGVLRHKYALCEAVIATW